MPKPGGLLDQDESHLTKLRLVLIEMDKHEQEEMNKQAASNKVGQGQ